jgi:hypothetical protein
MKVLFTMKNGEEFVAYGTKGHVDRPEVLLGEWLS